MGVKEQSEGSTNATIFLLRGLGFVKPELRKQGFMNAYVDDKNHEPHYKKAVYLLFKPDDLDDFRWWLTKEQERYPMILEDYDYAGGYVVVVYGFPEQFHREYEYFLEGKYSMFRQSYAKLFPSEVPVESSYRAAGGGKVRATSLWYHIFNRTPYLKAYWEDQIGVELDEEMEYWSKPNMETETLDINKIKTLEDVS